MLRARIESLESQVEAVLRGAPPNSLQAKQPAPDGAAPTSEDLLAGSHSLSPPIEESSSASDDKDARPAFEPAAPSSQRPPFGMVHLEEIVLLTTHGDSDTVRAAEVLASILTHAGWKVRRASQVRNEAGASPGLTLAAGSGLCRQRLSRTFSALSAAGYAVALHLDPNLQASETRLIIGRDVSGPAAGREFARASEAPFIAEVA